MPISQVVRAAVSGMVGHKLRVDVIANNLANVQTTGFKASRVTFADVLHEPHQRATTNPDLRVGAGVRPAAIQPAFTQGGLQPTETPTDLAIYGEGFFPVRLPDGTTGYTRNGHFRLDAAGRLVTADGLAVLPELTVPPDAAGSLTVDLDGTVRVTLPGEAQPQVLGQVQVARFDSPEGLEAIGQTLFRPTDSSGEAVLGAPNTPGFGQVVAQALEVSNVDMADQMTSLIAAQRAYGFSLKALQTTDEMLGLANNLRAR
ncbi:MAG: flagellar basal-body rod protein FlgG [Chloroflexota bacterium]